MGGVTRRTFLARAGVAAAATAAGGATLAGLTTSVLPAGAVARRTSRAAATRGEALVAHVRNIRTGEVAVFAGAREVIIQDRALVARLVGAVR
jgi:hypothetical protein